VECRVNDVKEECQQSELEQTSNQNEVSIGKEKEIQFKL